MAQIMKHDYMFLCKVGSFFVLASVTVIGSCAQRFAQDADRKYAFAPSVAVLISEIIKFVGSFFTSWKTWTSSSEKSSPLSFENGFQSKNSEYAHCPVFLDEIQKI